MTDELEFVNHWILIPIGEMLRLNVRAASRTPTLLRSFVRWRAGGGSSASPHTQLWGQQRLGRQGGEQRRHAHSTAGGRPCGTGGRSRRPVASGGGSLGYQTCGTSGRQV